AVFLARTRAGLTLRAVGENPAAAFAVGVEPARVRLAAVLACGALAGLGGAVLSLQQVGTFTDAMTNGRGYIALAAIIVGRWLPGGTLLGCLLFGAADALQLRVQSLRLPVSSYVIQMTPYVVALVVLAGLGRSASRPVGGGGRGARAVHHVRRHRGRGGPAHDGLHATRVARRRGRARARGRHREDAGLRPRGARHDGAGDGGRARGGRGDGLGLDRRRGRRALRADQVPAAHGRGDRRGRATRQEGRDVEHVRVDGLLARRVRARRGPGAGRGRPRRRRRRRRLPPLGALLA